MTWALIWEHLFIVLASCILSIAIGLPLGVAAYVWPKARAVILRVVDLLQTIPSLALLGIIMVFLGAGKQTVVLGITLYSLLPIVRNSYLGLLQVDSGIKEAARGMGMSRSYRILHVEFPLAFPMVFTGIRIAVVNAIGSAVFAAFVGGGGLGSVINQGIRIQNMGLILSGTGALMAIAVILDLLMGWFEQDLKKNQGRKKPILPITAMVLAVALLVPLGLQGSGNQSTGKTMVLYNGDFSEPQLMTYMVKLLVEDQTDLTVVIKDQMSGVNNFNSLTSAAPSCDMMIGYDGTLLTTYLKLDPTDVPEGTSLYDFANQKGQEKFGVRLLGKLGFNNTYSVAVPQELAEEYQLHTVSDLIPLAPQLVFGAEHEFFSLEGSMKYGPFTQFYGLNFKDHVSVDMGLKYAAIENRSFDVTEVYATDGLNRKVGLRILEDDQQFFPEYNGAFLVLESAFDRLKETAPNLEDVLEQLTGRITNEDMTNLTYAVDVEGKTVPAVAEQFLRDEGLLS